MGTLLERLHAIDFDTITDAQVKELFDQEWQKVEQLSSEQLTALIPFLWELSAEKSKRGEVAFLIHTAITSLELKQRSQD